jgi:hypothetical protein
MAGPRIVKTIPAIETGAVTAKTARTREVVAKRNRRTNAAIAPHGTLSGTMGTILTTKAADKIATRIARTRTKGTATAEATRATVNAVGSLETQLLEEPAPAQNPG